MKSPALAIRLLSAQPGNRKSGYCGNWPCEPGWPLKCESILCTPSPEG